MHLANNVSGFASPQSTAFVGSKTPPKCQVYVLGKQARLKKLRLQSALVMGIQRSSQPTVLA